MSRVIVALDNLFREDAVTLARTLHGSVAGFKVHTLIDRYGAAVCEEIAQYGLLMVDLKLHDIPHTMTLRATPFADTASYLTVHASNSAAIISAAAAAVPDARVAAVTILTSIDAATCSRLYGTPPEETVVRLALHAVAAGARAIVCSGQELASLHALPEMNDIEFLVPGVRTNPATDDQVRTVTPAAAIRNGATHVIIGREIVCDPNPLTAAKRINDAIGNR